MPETLKTETCVRCGIDLDAEDIGKATLCGYCECDLRNQEHRRRRGEPPVALQRPCSPAAWSVRPIFAWYDLWVGFYWDPAKRRLFFMPLPCVGLVFQFRKPENDQAERPEAAT